MATASLCSLPAQSPTLPTISLSPSLKPHFHFPSSSTKLVSNPICNDTSSAIPSATEMRFLAMDAGVEDLPVEIETITGFCEGWSCRNHKRVKESYRDDGFLGLRDKRRKKRRQMEKEVGDGQIALFSGSVKSRCLSLKEEAKLCLWLKEAAQVEATKTRIMETEKYEPTNKQLAIAMGIKVRCIDEIICKGRESREQLIHCYNKLVVSIAAPYQGKGLSLQDLTQEGKIGLLRGAEKFDPSRGHKLSTYAYWWIKQGMIRALNDKSRLVKLPGHLGQMVARIVEANNHLNRKLLRLPTNDEVAEFLNVHVSTIKLVMERSKRPISLDQPVTDRGRLTLQGIIAGPENLTPEDMVMRKLVKQELNSLLNTLTKRERYILRLYFGLDGEIPQSFEEIGKTLNLSRETIRRNNINALSKLRQTNILHYLKCCVE